MTNRIDEEMEKTAAPASAEMCPPPVARPKDNGTTPEMSDKEFYAAVVPKIKAVLAQMGVELRAQVHLRTDEDGCIRVVAQPIFVRVQQ